MSSEGKRYGTTVHDKRTGQPVRGCDGDAIAEIERLKKMIRAEHAYKASVGGSPCVCEICSADEKGTDGP